MKLNIKLNEQRQPEALAGLNNGKQ